MKQLSRLIGFAFFTGITLGAFTAAADELTYTPVNPNFGGSPFNGAPLLNNAIAQNKHRDTGSDSAFSSAFSNTFEDQLNRAILSRLSAELVDDAFGGANGTLQDGTFNTGVNTITITSGATATTVVIVNNETGDQSVISIPNFAP